MKKNTKVMVLLVALILIGLVSAAYAQDAKAAYKEGLKLFNNKKFKEAIPKFDSAIGSNKAFVKAYVFRGLSYYMLRNHAQAINDLNKAIQMDPENVTALFARGMAYLFSGKSQKAITDFTMVLQKQPENSLSYFNRSVCYYRLGQYKKAVSDSSKAISFNVKNQQAYFLRAACYWKQGLYEASVRDLKRAVDLRPDGPYLQLMYYLGKAHQGSIDAGQLRDFYAKNEKKADVWPYPAIAMMLGKIEPVDCIKAAEKFEPKRLRPTILQQANFFVAEFFFIHKDEAKAKKYKNLAENGPDKLFMIQSLIKHDYYQFKK